MCEIVRSLIAGDKIPNAKPEVKGLDEESVDKLDCAGEGDMG